MDDLQAVQSLSLVSRLCARGAAQLVSWTGMGSCKATRLA